MNTIFDNLTGNVDLSIFRKSNTDPKTPLRRHYLGLVGLLEYVDILNGDLTGRNLPDGFTEETVKGMIIHSIGDLDTMKAMSAGDRSADKYVDLGLPSGTLWAICNIGANSPEEAGLYFAWGETQGYTAEQVGVMKNFSWGETKVPPNDYVFGPINPNDQTNYGMKKYNNTDGLMVLESEDDAAIDNWGEGWKMPTKEQFEELITNTEYEWTEIDGVQGAKFTSKVEGYTDKFLFFPAEGRAVGGEIYDAGASGHCWSVSLSDENVSNAWRFAFGDDGSQMKNGSRYNGYSVRPVHA